MRAYSGCVPRSTTHGDAVSLPARWRAVTVAVVVAVTSFSGHWAVTGRPPPLLAVAVASALTALLVARRSGSDRSVTAMVLAGQAGFHALFTVTSGGGCLPVLGRAASAGVDLALLRSGVDCVTSGPVDTLAVALLAGLGALPVLAGHLLAGILGVRGAGWVAGLALAVVAVAGALGVLMPVRLAALAPVEAPGRLRQGHAAPRWSTSVTRRPLTRRGPPEAVLA